MFILTYLVSIITISCTHSSIFIKTTRKVHVKFTPTCFGSQMEPSSGGQQLILAKVYKWFNGASPYSQYCGGIRTPMCVCTASVRKETAYLYRWCTFKQISDNEIYLLIKYIKSVLWRVAKCLSYIEEARCLKVKLPPKLRIPNLVWLTAHVYNP